MLAPRCSLPDIIGSEDMLRRKRRRKRYALSGLKWHKTDLTWRCVSCHTLVVLALTHFLMNHHVCSHFLVFFNCVSNKYATSFQQCPQLPITCAVPRPLRQFGGQHPESRPQSLERRSPLELPPCLDRQQRGSSWRGYQSVF